MSFDRSDFHGLPATTTTALKTFRHRHLHG
jgi:hypothetical protein